MLTLLRTNYYYGNEIKNMIEQQINLDRCFTNMLEKFMFVNSIFYHAVPCAIYFISHCRKIYRCNISIEKFTSI